MISHRERILQFVASFPGRDDDEIARALQITPRQTVNIVCRKLAQEGVLRREPGSRGKLINSIATPAGAPVSTSGQLNKEQSSSGMTEDEVKVALEKMLQKSGWSVKVAWGRVRGIDIEATRDHQRWVIECKGTGSSAPMQNNYFLGVVGELLQRMHDDGSKHSIAFPDLPKYRRLWTELPRRVKARLELTALFVARDGVVEELS